jgi:hypothetical protein
VQAVSTKYMEAVQSQSHRKARCHVCCPAGVQVGVRDLHVRWVVMYLFLKLTSLVGVNGLSLHVGVHRITGTF